MAKKTKKEKPEKTEKTKNTAGEQGMLLDIHPKHKKEILEAARKYKTAQKARLAAEKREVEAKDAIRSLVSAEKLQRLDDGSIRFTLDEVEIAIIPRDELVRVTEPED